MVDFEKPFSEIVKRTGYGEYLRNVDLLIYEEMFHLMNKVKFKSTCPKNGS